KSLFILTCTSIRIVSCVIALMLILTNCRSLVVAIIIRRTRIISTLITYLWIEIILSKIDSPTNRINSKAILILHIGIDQKMVVLMDLIWKMTTSHSELPAIASSRISEAVNFITAILPAIYFA